MEVDSAAQAPAAAPVLQVSDLSFAFLPGGPKLLKNISFELPHGARCVVVGQNGAGKSTLMELLSGQKMAPHGTVKVCGEDPFRGSTGRQVALVQGGRRGNSDGMSEERASFLRVWQFLGLPEPGSAEAHGAVPLDARTEQVYEVLGLRKLLHRHCGSLSDGERRKTELARKLADTKQVVMLDEAAADLDVLSRKALLDFLAADGKTVVSVTHVFDGLEGWTTHLMHVHDGSLLRCVEASQGCAKLWTGCGGIFPLVAGWMREASPAMAPATFPEAQPGAEAAEDELMLPVVQVTKLTFAYASWFPVAVAVEHLELPKGCRCILVGPNGAGKSSLLNIFAGRRMLAPEGGDVRLLGKRAFHDHVELAPVVDILSSEWKRQVAELSAGRSLSFRDLAAPAIQDYVAAGHEMAVLARRMLRLIQMLGIEPTKPIGALSDGMIRRAQIGLKLLRPSKVLLVDEVTAELDVLARQALLGFLREEAEAGCTVVYCTHIMDGLDGWASHLLRLRPSGHQGELLELDEAKTTGRLLERLLAMLEEDAALPAPEPVAPPRAAANKPGPELPSGWLNRGASQAGNYGSYGWDAFEGSEDTWTFESVAPKPGPVQPRREEKTTLQPGDAQGGMLGGTMPGAMPGGMLGGAPGGMAGGMPGGMPGGTPGGLAGAPQASAPAIGSSMQQVQELFESLGGGAQAPQQQPTPAAARAPQRSSGDCPFGGHPRSNAMSVGELVAAGIVQPERAPQ